MSKSRGHQRHEEHEEHEEHVNHEAWVIPYADMLTLLMALFLVLFAVGRTDLDKFKKLAASFRNEFGDSSSGVVVDIGGSGDGAISVAGGGVLPADPAASTGGDGTGTEGEAGDGGGGGPGTTLDPADQALGEKEAAQAAAVDEASSLEGVRDAVEQAAMASGSGDSLNLTLDARGLVVTIVTDQVLFDSGSADLQPAGLSLLDVVGQALRSVPNDILVEGHTDDRPISNGRFADNWDLSNARATSVVRYFAEHDGIAPERLTPSGRSDTHPVADNATPEGAAKNRRVEVIVRAEVSLDPVLGDDGQVHTDEDGDVVVPEQTAPLATPAVVTPDVVPDVHPAIAPGGAAR